MQSTDPSSFSLIANNFQILSRSMYDDLQCQEFYNRHIEDDTMLPQKRELTRRSLMRAKKMVTQTRVEEKEIRQTYAIWKPYIALLSSRVKYSLL